MAGSDPAVGFERVDEGVTARRLHLVGWLALAVGALCIFAVTGKLLSDANWIPHFGQDFSASWMAATLSLEGRPEAAFDVPLFAGLEQRLFGHSDTLLWHYPPTYLTLVSPLGALDFALALIVFLAISLLVWFWAVSRMQPGLSVGLFSVVALSGAAWMCASQGQTGLLVGAALGAVLLALRDNRPVVFALATAFLLIKPHFGLLIPLILVASRRWDLFLWATAACTAFLAAATFALGPDYWSAFFNNSDVLLGAQSGGDLWYQQISVFAGLAMLGVPLAAAIAVHSTVALFAAGTVWIAWRAPDTPWQLRGAVFLIATLMMSPYAFHYDIVALSLALLLMAQDGLRRGFLPGERVLGAALWFAPLYHWPLAYYAGIPLVPPLLIAALWIVWRRHRHLQTASGVATAAFGAPQTAA